MRNLTAAAIIALGSFNLAAAAPRKSAARHAAQERFVLACVDERTGPTDGLETEDAFRLCRGIVRHQTKIAKLAKRAADARANGATPRLVARLTAECAEEVSIACEDTTVRDHDDGACSDATLEAKHAFDVCRGKAPIHAEVK